MPQVTITGTSSNGSIYTQKATYALVRNAATGDTLMPAGNPGAPDHLYSAQRLQGGQYAIWRAYLYFNTTSLFTSGRTIASAYLNLYQSAKGGNPGGIQVQSGMSTYPHDPLALGDYDRTNYSTAIASYDLQGTTGWRAITIAPTVIVNGTTKFLLETYKDRDGIAPPNLDDYDYIYFSSTTDPLGNYPQLVVTYSDATPSDIMARVSGLVHRFQTGKDGAKPIYQLEIYTGGLSSYSYAPMPNQPTPSLATLDYTALAGKQWFGHQIYYDIHGMFFVFLGPVGNQYRYDVTIWYLQNFGKGF